VLFRSGKAAWCARRWWWVKLLLLF